MSLTEIMEVIIETKPLAHIMNVGNAEAVSIKDWVTRCYACFDKVPHFVHVYDDNIEQRKYFSFADYEYYLDIHKQQEIYPDTIPLGEGLKESARWYLTNEAEVNKKPYFEFIDMQL